MGLTFIDAACRHWFGYGAQTTVPVLFWILARVAPLGLVAPWLGFRGLSGTVRAAVVVAVSLALLPIGLVHAGPVPDSGWLWAGMVLRELALGAVFAVAVSLPIYALHWSGEWADKLRAPVPSTGPSPLGTLYLITAVAVFFTVGAHRLTLLALARSFQSAPLGAALRGLTLEGFVGGVGGLLGSAFELALAFTAPLIVALLCADLLLGLASRAVPVLQGWALAMPLRAALGLGVVLVSLASLLPSLPAGLRGSIELTERLLGQIGGP